MSARLVIGLMALGLVVPGCDWSSTDVDRVTYRCGSSADCGRGFVCQALRCVSLTDGGAVVGDGGADAGVATSDAGTVDAGPSDGGALRDAGSLDSGASDASVAGADAGGGAADAGADDAGLEVDAGTAFDAGAADAGLVVDAGLGTHDAGSPDGGSVVDAGPTSQDAGSSAACHDGWCWVQPTPLGATMARMVSPSLVIASNRSSLMYSDGGAFTYLPDYGSGGCVDGVVVGGVIWLVCANGVLRIGPAGAQLLPAPSAAIRITASADGGIWIHGDFNYLGPVLRYEAGWIAISLPPCSSNSSTSWFVPLGAKEGLSSCSLLSPTLEAQTDLHLVSDGPPVWLGRLDAGLSFEAHSPDLILGTTYLWSPMRYGNYVLALDGGLTEIGSARPDSPVRLSDDGQLYQVSPPSLYQVVNTAWSQTQSIVSAYDNDISLLGRSGLQVHTNQVTLFFEGRGQVTPMQATMPAAVRDTFGAPPVFTGPDGDPRVVFSTAVYGVSQTGSVSTVLTLPVAAKTPIDGLPDGGFVFVDMNNRLVRYSGGNFETAPLSHPFPYRLLSTPGNEWLVSLSNTAEVWRVARDGGVTPLDLYDGGSISSASLRRISPTQAVVMSRGPTRASLVDLNTYESTQLPLQSELVSEICFVNGHWYATANTTTGLSVLNDAGTWDSLGPQRFYDMVCSERFIYSVDKGYLYDAVTGSWRAGSPAIGAATVGREGRLWVTGRGGAIVHTE